MNNVFLEDVNISKVPVHTHPLQETIQEQRVPPFLEREELFAPEWVLGEDGCVLEYSECSHPPKWHHSWVHLNLLLLRFPHE